MSAFRVLVVDDEPLAREVVVNLLRRDTEITGVTETGDPRPVPAIVSAERPDIVFLDIEMPGLSGIQIASRVTMPIHDEPYMPVIVFVTAFSQYALDAFEVQATDYLLKPFSDDRFFQTLDRAKRRVRERRTETKDGPAADVAPRTEAFLERLVIGHGDQTISVKLTDVLWIEAEDYYVLVHTRHGRHLMRASMASLEERLDPRVFVRAHRAAIVNVREVMRMEPEAAVLVLSDGTQVAVSRSKRPHVERVVSARLGGGGGLAPVC